MLSILDDLQRLVLDLHHDAQEMDVLAFNQQQMTRFSALLGFDSAVIASGTYLSTGRSAQECERIDSMHLHEASIEKMLARADMQVEDPALGLAKRTPGRAVAFSAHDGLFNDSASQAYYQAHGAKHTITCLTPVNRDGSVDVVGLWRGQGRQPYTAQELALADALLPHWYMARRHNARFNQMALGNETPLLILNERGCIEMMTSDAKALLMREWPGARNALCPDELWQHLTRQLTRPYAGRHVMATARRAWGLIEVRLRPSMSSTDRPLTPAESRAAHLVAQGLSYKAAAAELAITPATLRNQMHQAYAKLGVKSKSELAAAWHLRNQPTPPGRLKGH